ncbi:galactose-1-epimerase [Cloacibacterium normanense]|uniref:Aldose 1-epimerase n=1 Tax=Cloacibacterium normanense TaxID=237258 RepID=A0A2S7I4C5_9FLAO|nr:aldose epimerase family protein [Cloacibacterium normanense]PPZ91379.1 galactose-1-epimerase [Cloacibacterium normanense]
MHSKNNVIITPVKNNVSLYKITNKNGIEINITNYGATLLSLYVPTKNGKIDVVLGFHSVDEYIKAFEIGASPYFNAVVGRFAGRIKNAQFQLNGKTIQLDQNHGKHHLHGGKHQLSNVAWNFENYNEETNTLTFSYFSKANEFYPGDVTIEVVYTLTDENELNIKYKATTTEDTLLNLTNHAYFNLDGISGNTLDQKLQINAEKFLELDDENIPTGNFIPMENHAFDFRSSKNVVAGIDHCFVLKNNKEPAAILESVKNGLTMKVYTDQPAVQIYVGGKTSDELQNKESVEYHTESGICFETQVFPDAPNHEDFPNAILRKGETYQQNTTFQFIIS